MGVSDAIQFELLEGEVDFEEVSFGEAATTFSKFLRSIFEEIFGEMKVDAKFVMMIRQILEEYRQGTSAMLDEIPNPSRDDLLKSIERLDGKNRSSTFYVLDDERTLTVGGGGDVYIVFFSLGGDAEIYTLMDPENHGQDELGVVCGGQLGLYPPPLCVNKELTVRALLYFSKYGEIDPELKWQAE
ncbi:Imm1 family immunity protein [Serratia nevei]|uniref:Imm1 family immunity protein n=1 Tax=Serratia nevei TaxID=2703794 RepID=UPI00209EBEF4|nr:Imm1 family immunity protein [Serratia nevei]MCP1107746.1 Imm1 family immunity protein [Serratia nevei]